MSFTFEDIVQAHSLPPLARQKHHCDGKAKFATTIGAESAIRLAVERGDDDPASWRIYTCRYCSGIHIGHTTQLFEPLAIAPSSSSESCC